MFAPLAAFNICTRLPPNPNIKTVFISFMNDLHSIPSSHLLHTLSAALDRADHSLLSEAIFVLPPAYQSFLVLLLVLTGHFFESSDHFSFF